mmetsp:Transcript_36173/g.62608  ORF Transcript_36173/g.62608 Transcript_36173/m.62608 type:complete len:81 (-) Transcript_36173:114-356(-)
MMRTLVFNTFLSTSTAGAWGFWKAGQQMRGVTKAPKVEMMKGFTWKQKEQGGGGASVETTGSVVKEADGAVAKEAEMVRT